MQISRKWAGFLRIICKWRGILKNKQKKRQIKNMCMMAKILSFFCKAISKFCKCTTGQDVTCGQVWCPILGICALHLTHPSAHTQQWEVNKHTHTRCSGQSMLRCPGSSWGFGALLKGLTSVVVLRVERALYIHSPHLQSLPARDSNPQPSGYKSDSLTIRPQLPPKYCSKIKKYKL